jgi:glycosyltransferase involved in cell wall biosynthesis
MKIIFLTRRFYPDIGGVEKHVLEISKRFVQLGHSVTVISELTSPDMQQKKIAGIINLKIPVGKSEKKKKFLIWKWLWRHKKLFQDADVIHAHDVFFWYLPFRFLFPTKLVFTTFHGYESFPIRIKAIIVRKVSELLSRGNICIGDFIKKWYWTKPTYVSYGAVDVKKFVVKNTKIKKESALFFGRLDEQTGIKTYLAAFEILKNKYPRFELLVVGDGKYKKVVSKKTKTKGFQKDPERFFSHYHFMFVSRYLSLLEAFAAKKLIFAVYDNPLKEDYLRMTPFANYIIIEKDPEKLVRKLEYFLDNPIVEKRMTEKAYQWVKKQSWEELTKLYLTLWEKQK